MACLVRCCSHCCLLFGLLIVVGLGWFALIDCTLYIRCGVSIGCLCVGIGVCLFLCCFGCCFCLIWFVLLVCYLVLGCWFCICCIVATVIGRFVALLVWFCIFVVCLLRAADIFLFGLITFVLFVVVCACLLFCTVSGFRVLLVCLC